MKKILIVGLLVAVVLVSIGLVAAGNVLGPGDRNEPDDGTSECNCICEGEGNCICEGQCNAEQCCNQYMNGNCLKNSSPNGCCKIN